MGTFTTCLSSVTPVPYSLTTQGGAVNYTFYASCSETFSGSSGGFLQAGIVNSTLYLYVRNGDSTVAAAVSNYTNNATGANVDLFYSVGVINVGGSHALLRIKANASNGFMEFAAAGRGTGYCGIQMQTNGVVANATGAADIDSQTTSLCVSALDINTIETDCSAVSTFQLSPLGTVATSTSYGNTILCPYPGNGLNWVDASGNPGDSIYFGPASPSV